MRKVSVVSLAFLIAVFLCFISVHTVFMGVADDVTVTRQTLYGDPAAADGLNILVRNQFGQNLLWETSLTLDDTAVPKTAFTFSNERITLYDEPESTGLKFDVMTDSVFNLDNGRLPEATAIKYADLIQAYRNAVAAIPEGESGTFTLDYSEYMDYYPLEGQLILPDEANVFSEFELWSADAEKYAQAINYYFRIPVDGCYSVNYTIDKTSSGSSYGASVDLDYHMNASGVVTNSACYFTFNTVKDDGTVVATGLIPGGYGIYRLPFDENGLIFDEMEMVYALDPTEAYNCMRLTADGNRIRLYTLQGNDLMLTVIDLGTMTQMQKMKVLTYSEEWAYDVMDYDDFTLIAAYRDNSDSMDQIWVLEELPDGSWSRAFAVEMDRDVFPEGSNINLFGKYSNAVDYQDGKLAVIIHRTLFQEPYWYREYCDIYVAVYDRSGMVYAGTCEWNLSQVNELDPMGTRVKPSTSKAFELSW